MNYLYNGVELPELPEWDKETYPYAAIIHHRFDNSTYIRCLTADARYKVVGIALDLTASGMIICSLVDGKWDNFVEKTGSSAYIIIDDGVPDSTGNHKLIWTNFDAEYNGTLYLAASDPIPVNPAPTLDPTSLLMGWQVGNRIRQRK